VPRSGSTDSPQTRCNAFVDPLIESPPLALALDLVLLKPRVFLHLLFNRGSPPRVAGESSQPDSKGKGAGARLQVVTQTLCLFLLATLVAEVTVRALAANTYTLPALALTTARAAAELAAQLSASTALALAILRFRGWYPASREAVPRDGRQDAFLPALVPLVLLYTALIPLLLQLALGVWSVPHHAHAGERAPIRAGLSPARIVPAAIGPLLLKAAEHVPQEVRQSATEIADALTAAWDADPVWVGTRMLGSMSAGFGLRVLLPTRPWETTAIVLAGWGAAGAAAHAFDVALEYLQGRVY
jgi:hypothetical protein